MSGFVMIPKDLLKKIDDINCNIIAVYTYLSIKADHEDIEYRGQILKRGEWLTSVKKLHQKLNITESEVRKCINVLAKNGFITVVRICDKIGNKYVINNLVKKKTESKSNCNTISYDIQEKVNEEVKVNTKKVVRNCEVKNEKTESKSNCNTISYDIQEKVNEKQNTSKLQVSCKKTVRQINNTNTNTNTAAATRVCEENFEVGEFNEQFFKNFRNFVNSEIDKANSKIKKMQVQSAGGRANKIIRLIGIFGKEKVAEGIKKAVKSPFLNRMSFGQAVTIDWILTEENFIKIIEGNYDEKYNTKKNGNDIRDLKRRIGQTDDYGESTLTL